MSVTGSPISTSNGASAPLTTMLRTNFRHSKPSCTASLYIPQVAVCAPASIPTSIAITIDMGSPSSVGMFASVDRLENELDIATGEGERELGRALLLDRTHEVDEHRRVAAQVMQARAKHPRTPAA